MVTFRRVPDELIAAAHAKAAAKRAPQAPPSVRNAEALVAIGEHRPLRWRGHHYVVPPLSFPAGMRMMVIAQVLSCSRHRSELRLALSSVKGLLHESVRVKALQFPFSRSSQEYVRPRLNPFRKITAEEARALIDELLAVPDESPKITSKGRAQTVDLLDGYLEFCRAFPALLGSDGLPVSWAHYQYGMRQLPRLAARETLRLAQAARIGQWADKKAWTTFAREQSQAAGWRVN